MPQLTHYMVVRGAASEAKHSLGLLLHGPGKVSYTFNLAKSQQSILNLHKLGLGMPPKAGSDTNNLDLIKEVVSGFPDERAWLINPARLHVVAFVQDVHTGDVLATKMIAVNAGPHGELLKLR